MARSARSTPVSMDNPGEDWDLSNAVRPTIAADRPFRLASPFPPAGSQPQAIKELVEGLRRGDRHQHLLGITGSGKTYTIANVIAEVQRPTLILAHNKTLAAQLYGEFKSLFPANATWKVSS